MRRVIIESPYAGDVERNVRYARACLRDSLQRGEAPFASHLLYTQVLNDTIPAERALGIEAGIRWAIDAELIAVYTDFGISHGMVLGIAAHHNTPIDYRTLCDCLGHRGHTNDCFLDRM